MWLTLRPKLNSKINLIYISLCSCFCSISLLIFYQNIYRMRWIETSSDANDDEGDDLGYTRFQEDYFNSNPNPSNANKIPTKFSLIIMGTLATVLTTAFFGTLIYVLVTGAEIHDDEGEDATKTFLFMLFVVGAICLSIFIHDILKYQATFGTMSLLEDPEFSDSYGSTLPHWVEVNDGPSYRTTPILFAIFISALFFIGSIVTFVLMIVKSLGQSSGDKPPPSDGTDMPSYVPRIFILVTPFLMGLAGYWLKRSLDKYTYMKRFSNEPMVQGVYYAEED